MAQKRLNKILAHAGLSSRRGADKLIEEGAVKVNGKVVRELGMQCDPNVDIITLHNQKIKGPEKKIALIVNKPRGYVCSNKRLNNEKLAIDLVSNFKERMYTVGRLDRDTTGLLIITNDGELAKKVSHPSSNLVKKYLVKVHAEVTDEHLKIIAKGTMIEGKWIRPASVKKLRRGTLTIGVKEGKKHEVRLMVEAANLEIISLSRIAIGNLHLGPLPLGGFRNLNDRDLVSLFSNEKESH